MRLRRCLKPPSVTIRFTRTQPPGMAVVAGSSRWERGTSIKADVQCSLRRAGTPPGSIRSGTVPALTGVPPRHRLGGARSHLRPGSYRPAPSPPHRRSAGVSATGFYRELMSRGSASDAWGYEARYSATQREWWIRRSADALGSYDQTSRAVGSWPRRRCVSSALSTHPFVTAAPELFVLDHTSHVQP